jgi:hypothetical protein
VRRWCFSVTPWATGSSSTSACGSLRSALLSSLARFHYADDAWIARYWLG